MLYVEFSQISLNLLAVVCNICSKAALEQQIATRNLCTVPRRHYESHLRLPCDFRSALCSFHVALEQPLNITAREFREIYVNYISIFSM